MKAMGGEGDAEPAPVEEEPESATTESHAAQVVNDMRAIAESIAADPKDVIPLPEFREESQASVDEAGDPEPVELGGALPIDLEPTESGSSGS